MGCLSISIVTILFLSYPAISKLGLPVSNSMDVYWTNLIENAETSNCESLSFVHFLIKKNSVTIVGV